MRRPRGAPGQGWDPGSRARVLSSRGPSSHWSVGTEPGGHFFRGLPCFPVPTLLCLIAKPLEATPWPLSTVLSSAGPARSPLPQHLDPSLPETLLTQASAPQTPPQPHPVSQKTSSALSAFHMWPQQDLVLQLPCLTFALVQAVVGSHVDKCRIVQHSSQGDQWALEVRVTRPQRFPPAESQSSVLTKILEGPSPARPPRPPYTRSVPPPGHPTVWCCLCTAGALLSAEPPPGPRPPHLYSRGHTGHTGSTSGSQFPPPFSALATFHRRGGHICAGLSPPAGGTLDQGPAGSHWEHIQSLATLSSPALWSLRSLPVNLFHV